jgi:nitrilase
MTDTTLRIGLAQIAPAWLNRRATLDKVGAWITDAASRNCDLVVFG